MLCSFDTSGAFIYLAHKSQCTCLQTHACSDPTHGRNTVLCQCMVVSEVYIYIYTIYLLLYTGCFIVIGPTTGTTSGTTIETP